MGSDVVVSHTHVPHLNTNVISKIKFNCFQLPLMNTRRETILLLKVHFFNLLAALVTSNVFTMSYNPDVYTLLPLSNLTNEVTVHIKAVKKQKKK